MHTLYTPMLLLTVLALARIASSRRTCASTALPMPSRRIRAACGCRVRRRRGRADVADAVRRWASARCTGDVPTVPVLWRSSAPGVDLLAFFMPESEPSAGAGVDRRLAARAARAAISNRSRRCRSSASRVILAALAVRRVPAAAVLAGHHGRLRAAGARAVLADRRRQHADSDAVGAAALRAARRRRAHARADFAIVARWASRVLLALALAALTARFPSAARG